jgi:hypothetical protein
MDAKHRQLHGTQQRTARTRHQGSRAGRHGLAAPPRRHLGGSARAGVAGRAGGCGADAAGGAGVVWYAFFVIVVLRATEVFQSHSRDDGLRFVPLYQQRTLLRRSARATRAPARFAGSICSTQNLGIRANSLRSNSARL